MIINTTGNAVAATPPQTVERLQKQTSGVNSILNEVCPVGADAEEVEVTVHYASGGAFALYGQHRLWGVTEQASGISTLNHGSLTMAAQWVPVEEGATGGKSMRAHWYRPQNPRMSQLIGIIEVIAAGKRSWIAAEAASDTIQVGMWQGQASDWALQDVTRVLAPALAGHRIDTTGNAIAGGGPARGSRYRVDKGINTDVHTVGINADQFTSYEQFAWFEGGADCYFMTANQASTLRGEWLNLSGRHDWHLTVGGWSRLNATTALPTAVRINWQWNGERWLGYLVVVERDYLARAVISVPAGARVFNVSMGPYSGQSVEIFHSLVGVR